MTDASTSTNEPDLVAFLIHFITRTFKPKQTTTTEIQEARTPLTETDAKEKTYPSVPGTEKS